MKGHTALGAPVQISTQAADSFLRSSLLLDSRLPCRANPQTAVYEVVRRLGLVQMDPVRIIERNHDLVLHNRIEHYRPAHLERALADGLVFEYLCGNRAIMPMEEYPWFVPFMKMRRLHQAAELTEYSTAVTVVLALLEQEGPLPSRRIESAEKVSGAWDAEHAHRTKTTTHALRLLWECGLVSAGGRRNGEILFDLPNRAVPAELREEGERMSMEEAERFLQLKYYRAFRLIDPRHFLFGFRKLDAPRRRRQVEEDVEKGVIIPVKVEGVRRSYYCLSADIEALMSQPAHRDEYPRDEPSARIVSPLDNYLWRRERQKDLHDFVYTWEIYTPEAKRTFGPYTMPIIWRNCIPARIDLKHDRERRTLVVLSLFWEPSVTASERKQVAEELAVELLRLTRFLGADEVEWKTV